MIRYFRTLFPSWKFFSEIRPVPKVFYRVRSNNEPISSWAALPMKAPLNNNYRSWKALFHNPDENLHLACLSQIEELINDVSEDLPSITELTSYKIVVRWIENQILKLHPQATQYQFKIDVLTFELPHADPGSDQPQVVEVIPPSPLLEI